jgi:serine/threonine protein kinase
MEQMLTKIGRFEILGQLAHSDLGSVYKATDPEGGHTVVLKTLRLEPLGEQASVVVKLILEEAEISKVLNSPNLALLYGAGEIEGQLCACIEYIEGNSVSTMLARKEGFSIWDLQDVVRQTCQGLDHAHGHGVIHHTLEAAKLMVQWDGTVKILGFGISAMGALAAQAPGKPSEALHYMSPEQLHGDPLDARSNLFSLGAILYEMVTERKAFQGDDADQVRQAIMESMPVPPDQVNRKVHPALSEAIMKSLCKSPEHRYQCGRDLVTDLERCKEISTAAAGAKPKTQTAGPAPPKTASQQPAKGVTPPSPGASDAASAKKIAAAAGWSGGGAAAGGSPVGPLPANAQFISTCVKASVDALVNTPVNTAKTSAASGDKKTEELTRSAVAPGGPSTLRVGATTVKPDADQAPAGAAKKPALTFSDINELPPLKDTYSPASSAEVDLLELEPADAGRSAIFDSPMIAAPKMQAPKLPAREVAQQAVAEIRNTPPRLFLYAAIAAIAVILLVVAGIALRIRSQNPEPGATASQSLASTQAGSSTTARPQLTTAAPSLDPAPQPEAAPVVSEKPRHVAKKKPVSNAPPPPAAIIPGELTITSTPAGAKASIDGQDDASWITPFHVTGLSVGEHTVTLSKAGYGPENRALTVASGSKLFLVVQLAQLAATVTVSSVPPGAQILMDDKDTGRVTPAQITADKPGNHVFMVRKQGYLDETTTANLQPGQTFHFTATLKALGNTDAIKMGGKFKKIFGGGDTAGMTPINIKTQPKGAQVAVNNRVLDKTSPMEILLMPGNYVIDITLSGYKSIHRVITVEKGNKITVDEVMEHQ